MKVYSREITAERLRSLRESKGWSLRRMGDELKTLIGGSGKGKLVLEGDNGKQTVAQLESKSSQRCLSVSAAMAYATIFDVSLDYIYGLSNHKKAEFKEATDLTGLSDEAVKAVILNKESIPYFDVILNMVLENENCGDFISGIAYVKLTKNKLEFHRSLPIEELEVTYNSRFKFVENDKEKEAVKNLLLKELKEDYELERWRVSYKLGRILDAINSIEIYETEEWVEKEYENKKRKALTDNSFFGRTTIEDKTIPKVGNSKEENNNG